MAAIRTKKMSWVPKPSAWQQMQASQAKRQAAHKQAMSSQSAAAEGFGSAFINHSAEMAELAVKIAGARLSAGVQARMSALNILV